MKCVRPVAVLPALLLALTLAACAPMTPEQQLIDDAAAALGGDLGERRGLLGAGDVDATAGVDRGGEVRHLATAEGGMDGAGFEGATSPCDGASVERHGLSAIADQDGAIIETHRMSFPIGPLSERSARP